MHKKYKKRLDRVCDYIQSNLDDDLNLDCLADVAALSKFHFHRQFAAYTGVNVTEYVQLMRLKKASYRVAFSNDKIIEIALNACFESPEAFSRAFKRVFGQTPSAFRKTPDWQNWHKQFVISLPKEGYTTMDVKIIDIKEEKIAFIRHIGDPNLVNDTVAKFIAWRKETGLSPVKSSNSYGIPYSNPKKTPPDEFRVDFGGTILEDVPPNEYDVKTGSIPAGLCAVVEHKGSYDRLEDSVCYLYNKWLPNHDYTTRDFPVHFQYHNFIHDVDEADLVTSVYLPIKK